MNTPGTFPTFGFAGGLYDAGTGMLHFGAREYDPTLGRWLSRDAARWAGGLNFYAYAADDPVNLIDPDGGKFKGAVFGYWVGYLLGGSHEAGEIGAKIGDFLTGSDDDDEQGDQGNEGPGGSGGPAGGGSGGATGGGMGGGGYRNPGINFAHCGQVWGVKRIGCCRKACEAPANPSCTPLPPKGSPARACLDKCYNNPAAGTP